MSSGLADPAARTSSLEHPGAPRPHTIGRLLGLGEGFALGRVLATGAVLCTLYALAYLLLHGVVLDEVITPAQIIAGDVRYPAGHPHEAYYKQVYSLLHFVAAGLWVLRPSAAFVSALFDVAFLFVSVFIPFALTSVLTRRSLWGYAAAAFAAMGAFVPFQGTYPLYVFPSYFSNGHVGAYLAVLSVVLLLAERWWIAGLLLGALPAVHGAMAMVVWPWAAAYLLLGRRPSAGPEWRTFLAWSAVGVSVCAGLWFLVQAQRVAPTAAPYTVPGDAMEIYRNFTASTDTHRRLFAVRSLGYLVNPLVYFGLVVLLWSAARRTEWAKRSGSPRSALAWLIVLGAIAWIAVYGAWLHRVTLGPLPLPAEIAMPFRFSNFTAVLLVPLTLAFVGRGVDSLADPAKRTALLLLAAGLVLTGILWTYSRDQVTWLLLPTILGFGFAAWCTSGAEGGDRAFVARILAVGGLVGVSFGMVPQRWAGGVVLLLTFTGTWAALWGVRHWPSVLRALRRCSVLWGHRVLSAIILALSLIALGQAGSLASQRITPFDRELAGWLATNAAPDEPVLPMMFPYAELQPKTGHPTLLHWETLYIMAYTPELSPAINALTSDLLGLDFANRSRLATHCDGGPIRPWCADFLETWTNRTSAEWEALGRKYGFRLVLSFTSRPLALTPVLRGPVWTLHTIP